WTIVSVPSGSSLNALGDAATAAPYFGVDVAGNYTLQLIVNDGKADSQPDTVMISVNSLVISNVSPADGATDVSTSSKLSWEFNGTSSPKYDVYFGTSASPALVSSQQAGTSYDPGTLSSGQTYYWQVIGSNYGGAYSAPSSLMSFTTATTGGVPTCTTGTDITLCSNGVMTVANARSHFDSGGQSYYDAGATADVAGSFNSWLGGNSSAVVSSGGSWTISLTSMALAEGNNRLTPILTSSGLIVTWMSMSTFGSVDQSTFFGQAPNGDWSMKVKKTGSSYSTVPSGEILPQSPRWYRNKIKK
ncbi:hypothetical protein HY798_00285, partial [Candidatus Falkowbacteria bacterium]|nr:hypothetical protein [Candidatus Falkowbacteria bacterium]